MSWTRAIGQEAARQAQQHGGITGFLAGRMRGDAGRVEKALEMADEKRFRCVSVEPQPDGTTIVVLQPNYGADLKAAEKRADLIAGSLGADTVYQVARRGKLILVHVGPEQDFPAERTEHQSTGSGTVDVSHHDRTVDTHAALAAYPRVAEMLSDTRRKVDVLTHAGLVVKQTRKDKNPDGSACTVSVVTVPSIERLHFGPTGLMIVVKGAPGQTLKTYKDALPHLVTAWDAKKLSVTEPEGGTYLLAFNDVDPFDRDFTLDGPMRYDADNGIAQLGISSSGQPVELYFKGNSGAVVGGIVGSGKTASLMPVWAGMVGQAEFHVFDGKEGNDMAPLKHISRTYVSSDDLDAPLAALQQLDETRKLRMATQYALTGESNFWNLTAKQREALGMYLIIVILDECQTWLDTDGLSKGDKEKAEAIIRLVRTLIQKARSAGICVVLTTQKPDNTSMPTKIRDNCAIKICYAMETSAAAGTVLGTVTEGDPSPTEFDSPGRCAVKRRGRGSDETQSYYIPIQRLEAILSRWSPVPDQHQVAVALAQRAGLDFAAATAPDDDEPAPAPAPKPKVAPKAKAPKATTTPEPEPEPEPTESEPAQVETPPETEEETPTDPNDPFAGL